MLSCSSRVLIGTLAVCLVMVMLMGHSQSLSDNWSVGVQGQIGMKDESKVRLRNLMVTLELEDSIEKLFSNNLDSFSKIETATDADAIRAGLKLPQWRYLKRKVSELSSAPNGKREGIETDPPVVKIPVGEKPFILKPVPRENYTLATRSPPVVKKEIPKEVPVSTPKPSPKPIPDGTKSKVIPDSASESQVQKLIESESIPVAPLTDPPTPPPSVETPKPTQLLLKPSPLLDNTLVILEVAGGQDSFTCTLDSEEYPDTSVPGMKLVRVDNKEKALELDPNYTLFVREPVSAFVRMLRVERPECLGLALSDPKKSPLDIYIELGEARSSCELHHNRLTKMLAGAPIDEPATQDTFSLALQTLSSISSIFLSDLIDPSMHILAQRTSPPLQKYSVCQHHINFPRKKLDWTVASAIEAENKYDHQVYLQASRIFESRLHKLEVPFKEHACKKVNTCWDATIPHADRTVVERENLAQILSCNTTAGEMCTPVKGTSVLCLLKTCSIEK
eukprot:TRINITY_DN10748_c0_g1_i1.p1 TRINITY_DN10748_c0_g1~~TRINITY_DN10748_c0_g1_i1.p1  ORF type:complete len:506 (+),score=88.97 TRINITY_DN10748_c0_g1_i1:101-1618(+)